MALSGIEARVYDTLKDGRLDDFQKLINPDRNAPYPLNKKKDNKTRTIPQHDRR